MPPRKKKKPGDEKPPQPRGLRIEPTGRTYQGAVIEKVVRTGQRVAVWTVGQGVEDDPAHVGVLLGLRCRRDSTPTLAVAVNADTTYVPVADLAYACELPTAAGPGEYDEYDEGLDS